ncbi:FAD-dependent monooxygenase [Streptomyces cavernae]|uniref:FAD-dependent monooxygenase n=1 Tax=Streptomyces cavernae TaxID=2259034 RepID=UPI000FEBCE71|nr:FAD-dependent monooxygenase [Streptomyces cavernae]
MEEVVVVGAGPTGLWLAAELRLQNVPVTVLEARKERNPHSKALTVHPRTVEILGMRGLAEDFVAAGRTVPTGHFGALDARLDFRNLDTPHPFTLVLPQARTEELLEAHARALGAEIRRGHRVTALAQEPDHAHVEVVGPAGSYALRARYVVGCDGTRSRVREEAGIGFPGTDTTLWGWLGDVLTDEPPAVAVSVFGPDGGVMAVPLPGGLTRFVGLAPEDRRPDWPGELTLEEMRAKTKRVLGTDFGMRDPRWLSRFGNATRQAADYRKDRVLLAGDAAHMHFPTGGVGLNVGFQDATNLGWKLAATVRGTAPAGLLDTYHTERHPVGARLLASTRAQTALMTAYSTEGQALRAFLSELVDDLPAFSHALAERLAALDVRYPPADPATAHPLTGTRAPDLAFADGTSLFALMRGGRHVLLDLSGGTDAEASSGDGRMPHLPQETHHHRTTLARPEGPWRAVRAALIRPDGHVAWASAVADTEVR